MEPGFFPCFGDELAQLHLEIEHVFSRGFHPSPSVNLFVTLCDAEGEFVQSQERRSKRRPQSKADNSKLIEFYLPHEFREVHDTPITLETSPNPQPKDPRSKSLERVGKGQNSYCKLKDMFPLETNMDVHFILNHKYKIIQFGRAASVSQKLSADEGIDRRNLNPIYNCESFNAQFDTLADRESEANADMRRYLTDIKRRRGLILMKCVALDHVRDVFFELMEYPKTIELSFQAIEPPHAISYSDFVVISSIISFTERLAKSLKATQIIRSTLQAYQEIVRASLTASHDVHFVCDSLGVVFVNATHQLMHALANALSVPRNYKYRIFLDFFLKKKLCLNEILEEFEVEIADLVDNGGWVCTAILKYRELLCALDLNSYIGLMYDELAVLSKPVEQQREEMLNVARAYFNYGELFSVRFVFTEECEFFAKVTKIADPPTTVPIFPIFNMFDLNLENLPRDEQKQALKYVPF